MTRMETSRITVTGRGGIHVVPDVTRVELTVSGIRQEYSDCYELARENNKVLQRIMQMLGLDEKLPKTIHLDIEKETHTVYDDHGNFDHVSFDGYSLDQKIKIDLGMDNILLNRLVQAIGQQMTNVEISIGYTIRDTREIQMVILERAVKDAREKAERMARAAGCTLGGVVNIDYSWNDINVYSQAREIHSCQEAAACCEESLDITPDDLAANDTVRVIWELKQD